MKPLTITSSLVGLLLFLAGCSSTGRYSRTIASDPSPMEYVDVCNGKGECRKFSRLILGTDHLAQGGWTSVGASEMTDDQIHAVMDQAVSLGINFFDSSPIYVGSVENRLGKWLDYKRKDIAKDGFYPDQGLNPDRKLYSLSKGGFPFDLFYSKELAPGTHSEACELNLKQLGALDQDPVSLPNGSIPLKNVPPGTYASRLFGSQEQISARVAEELGHSMDNLNGDLTVYLMHRDDGDFSKFDEIKREKTPVKTIMETLSADALSKKYWMMGWSNWQTGRVNESVSLASGNGKLNRPGFNSPYFSLFEMSERTIHAGGVQVTHEEMSDPNFQKGIKIMPYSPLGGFSILDKPGNPWETAKKSAKEKHDQGDPYWQNVYPAIFTDANEARYYRAVEFTEKFNRSHVSAYTLDQMINAYALAHVRTDFLTVGAITTAQLKRTVGALALSHLLTPADLEYLHAGK